MGRCCGMGQVHELGQRGRKGCSRELGQKGEGEEGWARLRNEKEKDFSFYDLGI